MRRVGVVVAVFALGAGLVGCSSNDKAGEAKTLASVTPKASSNAPKPTGKEFTSPDGYSFVPPEGFTNYPEGAKGGISVMFAAPADLEGGKFRDNVNVVVTSNSQDLPVTVAETKKGLPTVLTNYQVVVDEATTVDGQEAHLLGGTFRQGTGDLQNLQLFMLKGGKQYTVTFTCPEASFKKLRAQAQASMLTLHVT